MSKYANTFSHLPSLWLWCKSGIVQHGSMMWTFCHFCYRSGKWKWYLIHKSVVMKSSEYMYYQWRIKSPDFPNPGNDRTAEESWVRIQDRRCRCRSYWGHPTPWTGLQSSSSPSIFETPHLGLRFHGQKNWYCIASFFFSDIDIKCVGSKISLWLKIK